MPLAGYTGVKVFSATKARDRDDLGSKVTDWVRANAGTEMVQAVVSMSSDREFHCLTIVLFYK